ncbi:MAG TPA: aromatic ring-hydroxylating dioxygenase subunit alpha [Gemmatimonadaceae bacterium]|nr:aromatic ring-hydroxylating dioxygenase subunit alpha [Gemmatimonadaceae bacterium]
MATFLRTVESFVQGARTMPQRYYIGDDVFALEQDRIFARSWLCVGRADELPAPGAYKLQAIGADNVIILREKSGSLCAFHNVCRHRGTRLCEAERGTLRETIQCPYHAWTYALDGRLIGAPHMQEVAGFDKKEYSLFSVALQEWEGFIFINMAPSPEPFEKVYAPLLGRFTRFNLAGLKVARRIEYTVKSNWKLVLQNYNECLHCPTIHPQLSRVLPYTSGANDLTTGPFLGGFMEIAPPHVSATMSGRSCGLPIGELPDEDQRRAYYYSLFPSMMLSIHPDYVVYYMVWAQAPGETKIISEWMFHPDTIARPDFDPSDAVEFWDVTNTQDWHICELSHAGIASRAYVPGPYSPRESVPAAWDREYLGRMGEGAGPRG